MTYDDVMKAWAEDILRSISQRFVEVTHVYVDIGRTDCYGHDSGDYCECDMSTWIEMIIRYKAPGGVNVTTSQFDDTREFLRELFERAQKSATTHALGS